MTESNQVDVDYLTRIYRQRILLLAVGTNNLTKQIVSQNADNDEAVGMDDDDEQDDIDVDDSRDAGGESSTKRQEKEEISISPSWYVTEHILDQLYRNGQAKQRANKKRNESSATTTRLHVCPDCGEIIQPGYKGTTLRVVRPKLKSKSNRHTLRRRRQRLRQRRAHVKQKDSKVFNQSMDNVDTTSNNSKKRSLASSGDDDEDATKNEDESSTATNLEDVELVPLVDDVGYLELDRHYLELKCGSCHGKIKLKGVKQPKQQTQSSQEEQQQQQKIAPSNRTTNQSQDQGNKFTPKRLPEKDIVIGAGSIIGEDDAEEDFMALPSRKSESTRSPSTISFATKAKTPPTPPQQSPPPPQSLLLGSSKKKKKKKPKPNKSQLMDFLSSLND